MPDVGTAIAILALGALGAAWVGVPLLRASSEPLARDADELDLVYHAASHALAEVEADHRAGLLDDAGYRRERDEAEASAAAALAALEARTGGAAPSRPVDARGPRILAITAAAIGLLVIAGLVAPQPLGLTNATVVDEALAAERAAEASANARINELLGDLEHDPRDTDALRSLADAYLARGGPGDLARAASALQLAIALEPDDPEPYLAIITAYIRAGDYVDARAALTAYEGLDAAEPAEIAFLDGLIALDGEDDPERAAAAFERFLDLAPDDPRATMVRNLREGIR